MDLLFPTLHDLRAMVRPDSPILEDVLRVSIVYLALLILFRFFRRGVGGMAMADILLLVIIADALQTGMVGNYSAVTNAVIIGAVLVFWDYLLDRLGYRFPRFRQLLKPQPLEVIRNGEVVPAAARKVLLTSDELVAQVRLHGVARIEDVVLSYVESNGQVSVITDESGARGGSKQDTLKSVL